MSLSEQLIKSNIKENLSQDFVKVTQGDFQSLKIAANQFIDKVDFITNKFHKIHLELMHGKSIKVGLTKFYQFMRQSTVFTQQALQLQHVFQEQFNNFLGRTVYLTYVTDQGHLIYLDDVDIGKLYQKATANKGRGNISSSSVVDTNDLVGDLRERLQRSEQIRSHVYKTAITRWSSNTDENKKNYNPSKNTFYWRLFDHHITDWTAPITNKGWIAQGYAGAVINEDSKVISSNIEYALKFLYENHIQQDSVGGAIQQDVILNENGQIQFAIKEGNFSTAMFGQYLRLAYNIKQINSLSKQDFQQYLPKLVKINKITNNLIKELNDAVIKTIQSEIKI